MFTLTAARSPHYASSKGVVAKTLLTSARVVRCGGSGSLLAPRNTSSRLLSTTKQSPSPLGNRLTSRSLLSKDSSRVGFIASTVAFNNGRALAPWIVGSIRSYQNGNAPLSFFLFLPFSENALLSSSLSQHSAYCGVRRSRGLVEF